MAIILIAAFLIPLNFSQALTVQLNNDDLLEELDPEIKRLRDEIQANQDHLDDLQKQQKVYEENLKIKRQEINSLQNQLGILDDSISKLEIETRATEVRINQTKLEIEDVRLQLKLKEKEISVQKQRMSEVIRLVDKQDRKKNSLEILVIQGTLSDFLNEVSKLKTLENSLIEQLKEFNGNKEDLQYKNDLLISRQDRLNELSDQLLAQQESRNRDKQVKVAIISQTRGQEASYQNLLAQAQAEQAQIESEIQGLEVEARKRILETDGQLPSDEDFIWPVPSRKVTAYFHDPDYPFRYIFEHPAIDIGSTPQGTSVRAAKSGYVARIKYDGTTSYAYIMLVHTGGVSTVYGHISKPLVEEDSFVVQGQVIGLSGGGPGTAGSGNLTTGPHLHFEVRLNGIPVDPLQYLP